MDKEQDIQEVIEDVRNLVSEEQKKGLKCPTTNEFLIRFIKASNYNVKVSFDLIQRYFKSKLEEPECFIVQSPSNYHHMLKRTDLGFPLKDKDKNGRRVFHLKFGKLDPRLEDWLVTIQTAMMILEAYSLEKDVQDNGITIIINCESFSLKIMKWATPKKMKIAMAFFQDCVPLRFEKIHLINYPYIFNFFYSVLSPFLYEEVKNKFVWHRNLSSLEDHIDKESLPIELGGELEDKEDKNWYELVLEKEDIFAEFRQMGYEVTK